MKLDIAHKRVQVRATRSNKAKGGKKERIFAGTANFTCANPNGEEQIGDRGGEHGKGETSSSYDCPDDRHRPAAVFVHKTACNWA